MTKLPKKSNKKPYFGGIWGPFWPHLGKNEFSLKKRPCQFLNIPIIYHLPKKSEKNIDKFLRKMANWQTDGQTDNDFIGPSEGWGPIFCLASQIQLKNYCFNKFFFPWLWSTCNVNIMSSILQSQKKNNWFLWMQLETLKAIFKLFVNKPPSTFRQLFI